MVALRWCDEDETKDGERPVRGRPRSDIRLYQARVDASRQERPVVTRRQTPTTFFWRRAMVLSVILGLGVLAWGATGKIAGAAGAEPPQVTTCPAGSVPGPSAGSCGQALIARPGDTIWSIAVSFSRGGDPRPLVAQLEAEINGGVLQPGQRLVVP
jgi:hypothetical protein